MAWRRAHGKAADLGRLTASETVSADELKTATPADTDRVERGADGRFLPGNAIAKHKRIRTGRGGHLAKLEAESDPAWRAAVRWGQRWCSARRETMAKLHGGELSEGPSIMIERAAQRYADAAFLRAKGRAGGKLELILAADRLERSAAADLRDAWHMARLEADSREAAAGDDIARQQAEFQLKLQERHQRLAPSKQLDVRHAGGEPVVAPSAPTIADVEVSAGE